MKVKYYDSDNKTVVIDVGNSDVELEDDKNNWIGIDQLDVGTGFKVYGSDALKIDLTNQPNTIILRLE